MKSPSFVPAACVLVLIVFAWEVPVHSAPADGCPSCTNLKAIEMKPVCGQEETEFQGSFRNFCEMLRFNCMNNRKYYVVMVGKRCDPDKAWVKNHIIDRPMNSS